MNIGIGKSTYAFMIADPLAVLEENQIHLGFSSNFRDPKDDWEQVLLHETDVLVARLPALLSSDIQKACLPKILGILTHIFLYTFSHNASLSTIFASIFRNNICYLWLILIRYVQCSSLNCRYIETLLSSPPKEPAPWLTNYPGKHLPCSSSMTTNGPGAIMMETERGFVGNTP